ncbi:MAG: AMP-binding protein [Chlorobi bacterium]|nr:AMP-binding protein [Chlorobiota bacterium]
MTKIKYMPHDFLKDFKDAAVNGSETYIEVIKNRVLEKPEHVVFRFLNDGVNENESLTYRQLELRSKALGAKMQEYGKKGDRVLLLFPPGLSYVASIFACFYSGFIAVPAYPPRRNHKLTRLNTIIADSGAGISIISRKVYNDIERNFADDEKLKSIRWIIYEDVSDDDALKWADTGIFPGDIALLQYTSGSTGNPKGVMLSQLNLLYNSEYIHRTFEFNSSSVGVNWLPIFHDMGLIGGVLQSAYLGLTNVGMPPTAFLKNPLNWLKAMEKYGGTTGGGPNFGFDYCLEKISDEDKKLLDLSKVKTFYCGAEPVRKPTMEAFSKEFGIETRQMYPVYGMAETTLIASGGYQSEAPKYISLKSDKLSKGKVEIATDDYDRKVELVGCGHAWMETVIEIVDPGTFNKLPELNVGEIWVAGPTVAKGYWEKPEETERTFNAFIKNSGEGPFLRTGDLGFLNDGELYITGRLKDMIIIRGVNYYPNDIEFTIQKNSADFRQNGGAAIPVIKDGKEKLVIVQELERTALRKDNHDELISLIRERISDEYELDVYAVCLIRTGSIPLTSSGKIQRRQTKYDYLNKQLNIVKEWSRGEAGEDTAETASSIVPSEEAIKEWLISWIIRNQQFRRDEIDLDKNIMSYGIDSLSAVTLEQEISGKFGFQWHVSSFMLNPTINKLAEEGMEIYKEGLE